jgi:hypothetical protein
MASAGCAVAVADSYSSGSAAPGDGGTNASGQGSDTASSTVGNVTDTRRKTIQRVTSTLGSGRQPGQRPSPGAKSPENPKKEPGGTGGNLLLPGDDGKHLRRPHPVSGWFAKAVAESNVPRTTPHDLRHTAASLAVSAGANVKAAQKMLGHASAAMTLDIYADLFDDDLEAVATALHHARTQESVGKMWARAGEPTNQGFADPAN